ncbi:hypothetical protein Lfu02_34790 [Longispora fulva]|nr:hypothetical protein Lfu02_34790 [Longispora fulva]
MLGEPQAASARADVRLARASTVRRPMAVGARDLAAGRNSATILDMDRLHLCA